MKIKILIIATLIALGIWAYQTGIISKETTPEEDIAYIEKQIESVAETDFMDEELSALETFSMSDQAIQATKEIEEIEIPDLEADFVDPELEQL